MLDKLREPANPYDFANPVSEERSFYGRSLEIADIYYYLKHAKSTLKPIHLALVGPRASGKTSFLNIAEIEAKRRDFCTVRVNLNEGDVVSDLDFFRKIFNSIVMAAFSAGMYGGKGGRTFLSYLHLSATGQADDIEEIPFTCAILISQAVKSGNKNFNVPDDMLMEDLSLIHAQIEKPIVILVDECNVLRENRIILEKIRNVFMNMSGYMLVFAATDDFFPVMDEVFSPIMRQFKRIDIGPFKGDEDVTQCVRNPLEKIGLTEREVRDLAPSAFIAETDALTGRKPYEIQLICHELFKRCQEGKSRRFSLNLTTLEAIQQVIARGQNIDDRPILKAARKMKTNLFNVLQAICGGTEYLSLKDSWRVEYLFNGNKNWNFDSYHAYAKELQALGFVRIEEASCVFLGDQFERIYLKYLARTKQARLTLSALSAEDFVFTSLERLASTFDKLQLVAGAALDPPVDIQPLISMLGAATLPDDFEVSPVVEGILLNIMYQDTGSSIRIYELRYKADIGIGQAWLIWQEPEHVAGLKKLRREFDAFIERGREVGFDVSIQHWDVDVLSPDQIGEKVQAFGDEHFATRISNELLDMVHVFYVRRKDKKRALDAARTAFKLQRSRLHANANNVGYLYMDYGDYEEARLWFQAALQYADPDEAQLHLYNSAVLHSLVGNTAAALSDLRRALPEKAIEPECIHTLTWRNGKFESDEIMSPSSLENIIKDTISLLEEKGPCTKSSF